MNKKYINTKEDSISIYLKDVRKSDTISQEEEIELAKRIKEGDDMALNKLVNANLRFVISIAKAYQNQGIPLADLISEGNYGLITAAKRFEHEKGFRFISYAVWWIKQSIKQCLNENCRTVRLPANMINKMTKIRKENDEFEKDNEREASMDEIEFLNIPYCTSLNTLINEEGDEIIDLIEDKTFKYPDEIEDEDLLRFKKLEDATSDLSDREKDIVFSYYGVNGEPMTLDQIGEEYKLTKERIRQIKESAIRKIRSKIGDIFNYYE